jgi:hypothetical protein
LAVEPTYDGLWTMVRDEQQVGEHFGRHVMDAECDTHIFVCLWAATGVYVPGWGEIGSLSHMQCCSSTGSGEDAGAARLSTAQHTGGGHQYSRRCNINDTYTHDGTLSGTVRPAFG